jgi:tubulin polyglutamylase TTLL6/13
MHLTNYAINKDNPNFIFNESTKGYFIPNAEMNVGHKRSLTSVYSFLAEQGYDVEILK